MVHQEAPILQTQNAVPLKVRLKMEEGSASIICQKGLTVEAKCAKAWVCIAQFDSSKSCLP